MFAVIKKIFLTSLVVLIFLTTGAWQNEPVVLAKTQNTSTPEIPLYPGFTWSSLGLSTRNIRINVSGESISLSGEGYQSLEQYIPAIHQNLLDYYSNTQLAKSGWVSYDSLESADGMQYVFYHESGVFLSVGFLKCLDVPSNTCVTVWKSEPIDFAITTPDKTPEANGVAAASTFGKKNPSDGQTNLNPTNTTLSWDAYSPTPDKYSYCINAGSACANNDPDWTSAFSTSITLTNLAYNTTYYWQVRAVTCETCTPKTVVYANGGTVWSFKTRAPTGVVVLGNAGVSGAVLSYTDGTAKTVTADATGAYSITVPFNWSGTITPSKAGYLFTPKSVSFTNLTAAQTIQNFIATLFYTISGNVGIPGVTLNYTDGTPKTVTTDVNGNYAVIVPAGWSSTITPSHPCYIFTPTNHSYSNVNANVTGQNFGIAFNAASACANVNVNIGGTSKGTYGVGSTAPLNVAYPTLLSGPVKIKSMTGDSVFASQRVKAGGLSFNELMGFPTSQLTTDYWFTWYDQRSTATYTWILVGNPSDTQSASVDITIGNVVNQHYDIPHNGFVTPQFNGLMGGPVRVKSDIPVFTSERTISGPNFAFNEVLGYPDNQLTTEYWFPWYDQKSTSTYAWILVGNPSDTQTASVDITIGNSVSQHYDIPHNGSIEPYFPGVLDGPVKVKSNIPVFTSERVISYNSFNEVMGYPANQFASEYWFPWYDNVSMNTWILVGNPSPTSSASVDIYIGGGTPQHFDIPANGFVTPMFTGVNNGPVRIVSNIPIFTSQRIIYGSHFAFNEMFGVPTSKLSSEYWFTWYDNSSMVADILIGKP